MVKGRGRFQSSRAGEPANFPERLTAEQEYALAVAWRTRGCQESREKLVTSNLRLVFAIAGRYRNRGVAFDDLVAEGNVGLIHAVDRFDPEAGTRLSTFAFPWIRFAVTRALRQWETQSTTRSSDFATVVKLSRAESMYFAGHGHLPDALEVCKELGWSSPEYRSAAALTAASVRAQPLTSLGHPQSASEFVARPVGELHAEEDKEAVQRILESLSPVDRLIVTMYFGLERSKRASIREIAGVVEMLPRDVNTRLAKALRKLRQSAAAEENEASRPSGRRSLVH